MAFLRIWVGMLREVGQRRDIIVMLVRSQLSVFWLSMCHTIPKDSFLHYLKKILPPDCLASFFVATFFFTKSAFSLGGRQGMLVNTD